MTDGTPPIRQATEADVETFGRILGAAFDDDPIIDPELMRRGIRKRGVFGLVGSLDRG